MPAGTAATTVPEPVLATDAALARLSASSPEERRAILEALVRQRVVQVLALDPAHVPGRDDDFRQYGMDSLMAMDLRNRLQAALGRSLSPTVALEHSTIGALAAFLLDTSTATGTPPPLGPAAPGEEGARTDPQLLAAVRARGAEQVVEDLSAAEVDRLLAEMTRRSTE